MALIKKQKKYLYVMDNVINVVVKASIMKNV